MTDRLSYTFGMTLPGTEPYSSIRFDVRYDSDVKKGETPKKTLDRIKEFVMESADSEYLRIKEAVEE